MSAARRPASIRTPRWPAFAAIALAASIAVAPALSADAPSTHRGSLLPLVQPLWSELTGAQQQVLSPFEQQWNSWSVAEKRGWLQLADRVPGMSDEQRERVDERVREWAKLTPEQRRLARQNYRLAKRLDPDERQAQWERYREMTPEQRAVLRTSGTTSNTAARHAGARTGLAKHAAQPLAEVVKRNRKPAQRPRRVYY
ncbi:MAG: DUF3106 domain-containing protein [Burkholderiaceae bacterium]|nr:DUF3106 domain-containing protein [Burkholderiaceae bacterium]